MKNITFRSIFSIALLLAGSLEALAGVTGKVSGVVKDKKTGDPMELANVVLVGTQYGGSTNRDGSYTILNVPAGIYDIKFAYLGYKPVTVKNIRVVPDITTTIDIELSQLDLDIDEIVVQANRPLFERGATGSMKVVENDDLKRLPIRGVENVVALQAGVVKSDNSGGSTRNAILNIRGGRGGEALVIVDGVVVNDVSANVNSTAHAGAGSVAQGAIDQLSVQVGGFEAKYGQAMSGVINTITRSGQDFYSLSGEVITSEFTDDFGYNLYSANLSGPVPLLSNLTFNSSYERIYTRDTNPRWGTDGPRSNMQGGSNKYSGKLDYKVSPGFRLTTSFNGSNRMDRDYIHDYSKANSAHNPRNLQNEYSISQKISYSFTPTQFINVDLFYRSNLLQRGDGVWFDNISAYGDTSFAYSFIDPTTNDYPSQAGNYGVDDLKVFALPHQVGLGYSKSHTTFYGGALSLTSQFDNHLLEVGGDVKQYTFRRYAIGLNGLAQNKDSRSEDVRFYEANAVAYGFDLSGNESDNGNERTTFDPFEPLMVSAYLQDKIELKDLIFNVGLRYDMLDPDGIQVKDPNKPINYDDTNFELGPEDLEAKPVYSYFSPRLGISFPVTENAKFHAHFGRFIGYPAFLDMYAFMPALRTLSGTAQQVNNGRVKPENTIQYEAGMDYAFSNVAAINVTAFYKEVRDLVNQSIYQRPGGVYYAISNIDFSTIKGISLSVNTRKFANYFTMQVNYLYQNAEGTGSTSTGNFLSAFRSGVIPRQVNPLNFNQDHTVTAVLDFRTGKSDGPSFGDMYPLGSVGLNIVTQLNSGRPYTPKLAWNTTTGDTAPLSKTRGPVNSALGPTSFRMDLRLEKTVDFSVSNSKFSTTFFLDIINLLDNENAVNVYSATGEPDNDGFLNTESGQTILRQTFPTDPVKNKQYEQELRDYQNDPSNFGSARQIRVGMRFDI